LRPELNSQGQSPNFETKEEVENKPSKLLKFQSILGNKGFLTVTHQMLKCGDKWNMSNFEYAASQTYSSRSAQYCLASKLREFLSKKAASGNTVAKTEFQSNQPKQSGFCFNSC